MSDWQAIPVHFGVQGQILLFLFISPFVGCNALNWQEGLLAENMTSNLFMYYSKGCEKFLFWRKYYFFEKIRIEILEIVIMQRGRRRKGWHYQLEYFEDEKRQTPLEVVAFSTFQVQDNTQGPLSRKHMFEIGEQFHVFTVITVTF